MEQVIPAEAVEAAAWSVYNVLHPEAAATSLGQVGEPMRLVSEGIARAALEAAAPHMLAGVWDEATEAHKAWTWDDENMDPPTNPYRLTR